MPWYHLQVSLVLPIPDSGGWVSSGAPMSQSAGCRQFSHACRGTFYVQYQEMELLGEGAFGKALKCRRRRDNQMFVVKIMHESKMSEKAREEVGWCQRLPDAVTASARSLCALQAVRQPGCCDDVCWQ